MTETTSPDSAPDEGSAAELLTASEGAPPAELELLPLPAAELSPAVQKLLATAGPIKTMATKGLAPLRPADLGVAIYQLSFDEDPAIRGAADAAPGLLPDKVVLPVLTDSEVPEVLHFFALRLAREHSAALEKVLYNRATADPTFVVLAGRLYERELEIIVENEARLLRCPAIVQALFGNRQARMSSVNRAIELCARHNVRVAGIPAFEEVARSIRADATSTEPAADQAFAGVLAATDALQDPAAREPTGGDAEAEEAKRRSHIIDFLTLKLHEKIRLATLGNAYCRNHLMRDSNRLVALAAIRSPLITEQEVAFAASSRSVSEDVIRYVANTREYTKIYAIRLNLTTNPKCPLALSMRFLPHLNGMDVKKISLSKNVPGALAATARRLMQTRTPGK